MNFETSINLRNNIIYVTILITKDASDSVEVKALCYKPEGRGFYTQ
jgi:hypothetical protein